MSKSREPIFTKHAPEIMLCSVIVLIVGVVMYWIAIAFAKAVLIAGVLVLVCVALVTLIWAIRSGALTLKKSIRFPAKRRRGRRKLR
jgi:hypothetical protein